MTVNNLKIFTTSQGISILKGKHPKLAALLDQYGTTQTGTSDHETFHSFAGNDRFEGKGGQDTFVFTDRIIGHDTILDFNAQNPAKIVPYFATVHEDHDTLRLSRKLFADEKAVLTAAHQEGNDLVLRIDQFNSITLKNVSRTDFDTDDFYLVA